MSEDADKKVPSLHDSEYVVPDERILFWTEWAKSHPEEVGKMLAQKESQSEHDPLTGLLNRRGFTRQSESELSELKRRGKGFSFVFGDLNGLKIINDTQGHKAGDEFIKSVANCIRTCIRESDLPARMGGDELAIFLPETNIDQASEVVSRINVVLPKEYSVTFAVGEWDGKKDIETLMQETDAMVNEIKHSGLKAGERSQGVNLITLSNE